MRPVSSQFLKLSTVDPQDFDVELAQEQAEQVREEQVQAEQV